MAGELLAQDFLALEAHRQQLEALQCRSQEERQSRRAVLEYQRAHSVGVLERRLARGSEERRRMQERNEVIRTQASFHQMTAGGVPEAPGILCTVGGRSQATERIRGSRETFALQTEQMMWQYHQTMEQQVRQEIKAAREETVHCQARQNELLQAACRQEEMLHELIEERRRAQEERSKLVAFNREMQERQRTLRERLAAEQNAVDRQLSAGHPGAGQPNANAQAAGPPATPSAQAAAAAHAAPGTAPCSGPSPPAQSVRTQPEAEPPVPSAAPRPAGRSASTAKEGPLHVKHRGCYVPPQGTRQFEVYQRLKSCELEMQSDLRILESAVPLPAVGHYSRPEWSSLSAKAFSPSLGPPLIIAQQPLTLTPPGPPPHLPEVPCTPPRSALHQPEAPESSVEAFCGGALGALPTVPGYGSGQIHQPVFYPEPAASAPSLWDGRDAWVARPELASVPAATNQYPSVPSSTGVYGAMAMGMVHQAPCSAVPTSHTASAPNPVALGQTLAGSGASPQGGRLAELMAWAQAPRRGFELPTLASAQAPYGGAGAHALGGVGMEHVTGRGGVDHMVGSGGGEHMLGSGGTDHMVSSSMLSSGGAEYMLGGGGMQQMLGGGGMQPMLGGGGMQPMPGGGRMQPMPGGGGMQPMPGGGGMQQMLGGGVDPAAAQLTRPAHWDGTSPSAFDHPATPIHPVVQPSGLGMHVEDSMPEPLQLDMTAEDGVLEGGADMALLHSPLQHLSLPAVASGVSPGASETGAALALEASMLLSISSATPSEAPTQARSSVLPTFGGSLQTVDWPGMESTTSVAATEAAAWQRDRQAAANRPSPSIPDGNSSESQCPFSGAQSAQGDAAAPPPRVAAPASDAALAAQGTSMDLAVDVAMPQPLPPRADAEALAAAIPDASLDVSAVPSEGTPVRQCELSAASGRPPLPSMSMSPGEVEETFKMESSGELDMDAWIPLSSRDRPKPAAADPTAELQPVPAQDAQPSAVTQPQPPHPPPPPTDTIPRSEVAVDAAALAEGADTLGVGPTSPAGLEGSKTSQSLSASFTFAEGSPPRTAGLGAAPQAAVHQADVKPHDNQVTAEDSSVLGGQSTSSGVAAGLGRQRPAAQSRPAPWQIGGLGAAAARPPAGGLAELDEDEIAGSDSDLDGLGRGGPVGLPRRAASGRPSAPPATSEPPPAAGESALEQQAGLESPPAQGGSGAGITGAKDKRYSELGLDDSDSDEDLMKGSLEAPSEGSGSLGKTPARRNNPLARGRGRGGSGIRSGLVPGGGDSFGEVQSPAGGILGASKSSSYGSLSSLRPKARGKSAGRSSGSLSSMLGGQIDWAKAEDMRW